MQKFKVLEYNRRLMSAIGTYSDNLSEPTNEFFKSFFSYFILFHALFMSITSSAVFMYKNFSEMSIFMEAFLIFVSGFQYGGMYLGIGLNMVKLKALHLKLQEMVDEAYISSVYLIF